MVITSAHTHVSSPNPPEPSGSVKDSSEVGIQEKSSASISSSSIVGTPDHLSSRVELCKKAHVTDVAQLASQLGVNPKNGLPVNEAADRLAEDGPNKVEDTQRVSVFQILVRQVSNSLTFVLGITMILSFSLDDYVEGSVITAVVLLNIVVGFVQDYRAEQSILSLQALSSPECNVVRGSRVSVVRAETLVVGDIVQLSTGDIIPADLRLVDSPNLCTDEALLTGESAPVSKDANAKLPDSQEDMPIGDRFNMAYSASTVTRGRGSGIVVATGMRTEMGKIAALLQNQRSKPVVESKLNAFLRRAHLTIRNALGLIGSPLQVSLSKFALILFALAIALAIIVFSVSLWDVTDDVLIYGICVAIAIIPESLIAVLTLTIAVGTQAMAKNNVIIRRLSSLEAVGRVTNICSDKTGTLTMGKMIVRQARVGMEANTINVRDTTDPLNPASGSLESSITLQEGNRDPSFTKFLDIISLCNLAQVQKGGSTTANNDHSRDEWVAFGEPTEIALQVFAMRFQHGKSEAISKHARTLIAEFQFESAIKRMSVAYSSVKDGFTDVFAKGATESLVPLLTCSDEEKRDIEQRAEDLAAQGLRVLCLASKTVSGYKIPDRQAAESDLEFAGLVGIYDPPRSETLDAVRTCQSAGITVHMLTGDHVGTASAIAAEVGILPGGASSNTQAMLATDFDKLTDDQIDELETLPLVLARCSPATKVRMIEALHRRAAFCIMTGDGINDSPALKLADIGIAMGLNGSDVAKQAADMVLADDNFASIVSGIREGRRLFDNIQKFLLHLLTSNIAQVVFLMVGLAFKDEEDNSVFPLSALSILWVNLVTSAPLALGLGLEPAVQDIMERPPQPLNIGIFTWELIIDKMVYGCSIGALCLYSFSVVVYGVGNGDLGHRCNDGFNPSCKNVFRARSTVFAVLSFALLILSWEVIDFKASLFNMRVPGSNPSRVGKIFSVFPTVYQNKFLFWSCIAGFAIVFPLVYIPELNVDVFKQLPLTWEWGIITSCVVLQIMITEFWKWAKRGKLGQLVCQTDARFSVSRVPQGAHAV